jgi:hypothetical protein
MMGKYIDLRFALRRNQKVFSGSADLYKIFEKIADAGVEQNYKVLIDKGQKIMNEDTPVINKLLTQRIKHYIIWSLSKNYISIKTKFLMD